MSYKGYSSKDIKKKCETNIGVSFLLIEVNE